MPRLNNHTEAVHIFQTSFVADVPVNDKVQNGEADDLDVSDVIDTVYGSHLVQYQIDDDLDGKENVGSNDAMDDVLELTKNVRFVIFV